jgi:hypothetical protein
MLNGKVKEMTVKENLAFAADMVKTQKERQQLIDLQADNKNLMDSCTSAITHLGKSSAAEKPSFDKLSTSRTVSEYLRTATPLLVAAGARFAQLEETLQAAMYQQDSNAQVGSKRQRVSKTPGRFAQLANAYESHGSYAPTTSLAYQPQPMMVNAGNHFMYPTQANQQSAMMTVNPNYHQQQQQQYMQEQQQQQPQQQQQRQPQRQLTYAEEYARSMEQYDRSTGQSSYIQAVPQQQQAQMISAGQNFQQQPQQYHSLNKRGRDNGSEEFNANETTRDTSSWLKDEVFKDEALKQSFLRAGYNKAHVPIQQMQPTFFALRAEKMAREAHLVRD